MRNLIALAETRVRIKSLTRQAEECLTKMDRTGISAELLQSYENLDTQIITERLQLVDGLRRELRERQEDE